LVNPVGELRPVFGTNLSSSVDLVKQGWRFSDAMSLETISHSAVRARVPRRRANRGAVPLASVLVGDKRDESPSIVSGLEGPPGLD
jgi:hypothetical protein